MEDGCALSLLLYRIKLYTTVLLSSSAWMCSNVVGFPSLLLAFYGDADCQTDLDFLLFGVFHGVFTQRLKECVI